MDAQSATEWGPRLRRFTEVLLVVFGAYLVASVLLSAMKPAVVNTGLVAAGSSNAAIVGYLLQYAGFLLVVGWYTRSVVAEPVVDWHRPNRWDIGYIVAGVVGLVAANRGITRLFSRFNVDVGTNAAITTGAGDPGYLLAMVIISLVVVGPAEEALFRGVVQGRLRESVGVWPAILVATVLFGLSHASVSGGLGGIAAYVLTATVLGILLGYLYERTENIIVPTVVHGCNNAVIFAGLYVQETGLL